MNTWARSGAAHSWWICAKIGINRSYYVLECYVSLAFMLIASTLFKLSSIIINSIVAGVALNIYTVGEWGLSSFSYTLLFGCYTDNSQCTT